jgi:hypothetical protein
MCVVMYESAETVTLLLVCGPCEIMDILLAMFVLDIIGTPFHFLRHGLPKIENLYI